MMMLTDLSQTDPRIWKRAVECVVTQNHGRKLQHNHVSTQLLCQHLVAYTDLVSTAFMCAVSNVYQGAS